jgi:hypothetical protein
MAHVSQADLTLRLAEAAERVPTGGKYRHYKQPHQYYIVTGHVIMESDDTAGIVYRAEYGERITFVRPLASWLEKVEYDGKAVSRFQRV